MRWLVTSKRLIIVLVKEVGNSHVDAAKFSEKSCG